MTSLKKLLTRPLEKTLRSIAYEDRSSHINAPPSELFIEPTSQCNLKCPMCPQSTGLTRKHGFMDMELFRKVIKDAAEIGIPKVSLFMGGESLLHKNIADMVREAE
ncbi:MAG: radical SAM protein, partial [Deltaproteobacteria bacterium]|nr:radical SAM protein [Deltaproteobacteria bacterium]